MSSSKRSRAEHADRLSHQQHLPPIGHQRHGPTARAAGADLVISADRHDLADDQETLIADLTTTARPRCWQKAVSAARATRTSSRRPARRACPTGHAGRRVLVLAAIKLIAEAGLWVCPMRQVDLSVARVARETEDCRLSVYDAAPTVGWRTAVTSSCWPTFPVIEGAHDGAGLGDRFWPYRALRAMLHLVDGSDDPAADYHTVRCELEAYGHGWKPKPRLRHSTKPTLLTMRRSRGAACPAWADSMRDLARRPE